MAEAGPHAARRPTRRLIPLIAFGLALIALAVAGWLLVRPSAVTARPALWEATLGDRKAYLFGTIHAVPAGATWLSPRIEQAVADSATLVLEVTDLAEERRERRTFELLGRGKDLPPIADRLEPSDRALLDRIAARAPDALHGLDGYESWAAALLVSAAASGDLDLSNAEAGEARFEAIFARQGKPVLGLETVSGQLGLFDRLPETDQRTLLVQSIREAGDARALYDGLYKSWAGGDLAALERQFVAPLASHDGLRIALIDGRNARWARRIDQLAASRAHGTLFIAVGAGHLLGQGSVQARLTALGWTVKRLQ